MYFARVFLNPMRRATRGWVASPQRLHAAVLAGFPGPDHGRVLWRLDRGDHRMELLVVAPTAPDLMHFVELGGWGSSPPSLAEYSTFLQAVAEGRQYRFRLRANTVRSVKDEGQVGGRGRVKSVGSREQQEQWLAARAEPCGFRIPEDCMDMHASDGSLISRRNLALTSRDTLRFTKGGGDADKPVTLATAQFDGLLEVTDPDRLRRTLREGIGRGKAYGCGLLTLAPVQ